MKYIGGDIEYNGPQIETRDNHLELSTYAFYSTGRTALKKLLSSNRQIKKILVPSYFCVSILQPIIELNIKHAFYKIDSGLSINISDLEEKLEKNVYDAVLYINYFGFIRFDHLIINLKSKYEKIIFIEDNTHLTFIPEILQLRSSVADFEFGSLRKVFGITDGGYIRKNDNYDEPEIESKISKFFIYRHIAKLLRREYLKYNYPIEDIESVYLELVKRSEDDINEQIPLGSITNVSFSAINSCDFIRVWQQRRRNYQQLDDLFKTHLMLSDSVELFNLVLGQASMPYMYPVKIRQSREIFRSNLLNLKIFTPIIWTIPLSYKIYDEFKDAMEVSNSIVCLPIDQRYDLADMNYMFDIIKLLLEDE